MYEQEKSLSTDGHSGMIDANARAPKKKSSGAYSMNNVKADSSPEPDYGSSCKEGVCLVSWKPQRPAA